LRKTLEAPFLVQLPQYVPEEVNREVFSSDSHEGLAALEGKSIDCGNKTTQWGTLGCVLVDVFDVMHRDDVGYCEELVKLIDGFDFKPWHSIGSGKHEDLAEERVVLDRV
jgi:hypothetical protein